MNIVIDIETIPTGDKLSVEDLTPPGNMSKKETLDAWWVDKAPLEVDKEYRKRALIPHKCRVVCWSIKSDAFEGSMFGDNEHDLLECLEDKLREVLHSPFEVTWIGVNIRGFDLVILRQRAFLYKLGYLYQSIPKSPNSDQIIDLIDVFTWSKHKDYLVSKDAMCKFFGIEVDDENDGSKIYDLYLEGKYDDIKNHCIADVDKEFELYNKMFF